MCCVYYFDDDTIKEIHNICEEVDRKVHSVRKGDIHPTDYSPLIMNHGNHLCAEAVRWGYPGRDRQLIINARSETVFQKRMFARSASYRRCVVPARHFYEWDRSRNKGTFSWEGHQSFFMAGLYDMYDNEKRFVILTTAANESMIRTHDRMPLILDGDQAREWILDPSVCQEILSRPSPMLMKHQEYEQLTLEQFLL